MRFLRQNTATRVTVGPFFDKTDGVTPEVALTVTACKLTLMVDTGGVPTLVIDAAPTASGGNNDMVHVTGDDAGFYDLELTAAQLNYVGRAMLAITDAATHCPVFHEFTILAAQVYDSLVEATDALQVHANEITANLITATAIASGAITSAKFAAGAIDAAAIAADAIGASELAADAVAEIADAIWDEAKAGHVGVGSFGEEVQAHALTSEVAAVESDTIDIQARLPAALVGGRMAANAEVVGDKTGYALSAAGVQAIWDALTSALTTAGSIGKRLADYVDAAISSRGTGTALDAAGVRSAVGLSAANLDTQLADLPTAAENADAVWDEAISGHLAAGSTGEKLNDAGAAGDPWATALPGAYGAGTAGKIVGDNLNAPVSAVEADTQDIQARLPAALVGGKMDANASAISGDAVAADNLEAMLDGTGGVKLSLSQLKIVAAGNDSAIDAAGAGTGHGMQVVGGATGQGLLAEGGATSGNGLWARGGGNGAGIIAEGEGAQEGFGAYGGNTAPGYGIVAQGGLSGSTGLLASGTDYGIYAAEVLAIASQVWDEARAGHVAAGTFGAGVEVATKTGFALTSTEHTNIADALLKRDFSAVTGEAARSVLNALRSLRNKVTLSGSTLTVKKEDDSTTAWTAAATLTSRNPVTEVDPD